LVKNAKLLWLEQSATVPTNRHSPQAIPHATGQRLPLKLSVRLEQLEI